MSTRWPAQVKRTAVTAKRVTIPCHADPRGPQPTSRERSRRSAIVVLLLSWLTVRLLVDLSYRDADTPIYDRYGESVASGLVPYRDLRVRDTRRVQLAVLSCRRPSSPRASPATCSCFEALMILCALVALVATDALAAPGCARREAHSLVALRGDRGLSTGARDRRASAASTCCRPPSSRSGSPSSSVDHNRLGGGCRSGLGIAGEALSARAAPHRVPAGGTQARLARSALWGSLWRRPSASCASFPFSCLARTG